MGYCFGFALSNCLECLWLGPKAFTPRARFTTDLAVDIFLLQRLAVTVCISRHYSEYEFAAIRSVAVLLRKLAYSLWILR